MTEELNYDHVLEELSKITQEMESKEYPKILDEYLKGVAKSGDIVFPWEKVKNFFKLKLIKEMDTFNATVKLGEKDLSTPNCKRFDFEDMKQDILKAFDWFSDAPFTIQRLCELLVNPLLYYHRTDKFLRGLEKNVMVVSTVVPRPSKYSPEAVVREQSIRDFYQRYNANHVGHSYYTNGGNRSDAAATGSASALNGLVDGTGGLNNGNNSASGSSYSSTGGSYLGSMSSLYDNHQSQQHHHHPMAHGGSGPLDPMGEPSGSLGHHQQQHHQQHSPHQSPHHHSSHLAPLQQLDSFTNVFAASSSTSSHHYTVNGDAGNSSRTGGSGADALNVGPMLGSQSSSTRWMASTSTLSLEMDKEGGGGGNGGSFSSLLQNAMSGGRGSPDDENIVVDDEDDDDSDLDHTPEEEEDDEDDDDDGNSSTKSPGSFTDSGSNSSNSQDSLPVTGLSVIATTSSLDGQGDTANKMDPTPANTEIEASPSTASSVIRTLADAQREASGDVVSIECTSKQMEEVEEKKPEVEAPATDDCGVKKMRLEQEQEMASVAEDEAQPPHHSAILEAIVAEEEVKVVENVNFQEVMPDVELDELEPDKVVPIEATMTNDDGNSAMPEDNVDEEMAEPMEQE